MQASVTEPSAPFERGISPRLASREPQATLLIRSRTGPCSHSSPAACALHGARIPERARGEAGEPEEDWGKRR